MHVDRISPVSLNCVSVRRFGGKMEILVSRMRKTSFEWHTGASMRDRPGSRGRPGRLQVGFNGGNDGLQSLDLCAPLLICLDNSPGCAVRVRLFKHLFQRSAVGIPSVAVSPVFFADVPILSWFF